ncbi:MAG: hypothetical protein HKM94_06730, partial [Halobacteria archaeon]|nr:hypothetical protein [Halobacteria archaeon]
MIEKTIEVSPVMFEVLNQGRDTLPHLFELFKTGGQAKQTVLALMSAADDLSQGIEVEWKAAEPVAPPAEDVEIEINEAVTPETEIEIPEVLSPEVEIEAIEIIPEEESQTAASGTSIDSTPLPDIDPVLLDIYRKEVETHLNTLRQYFAGWHANIDRSANDHLLRALHTLTGSSRTTGVEQVSDVCSQFEKHIKELQKNKKMVSGEAVVVLEQTIQYIDDTTAVLDQAGAVIAENSKLMQSVEALGSIHTTEAPSLDVTQEESPPDDADILIEPPAIETIEATPVEEPPSEVLAPRDYDEELLEIFIEEGEEILEESDHILTGWIENTDDMGALEALQRHLHTLKGGARMAGVLEIGDLGHSIESMLTAVVDGRLTVSKQVFTVLQQAQDRLVHLLEQVKANQGLASANDIITQGDELLGLGSLGKDARPESSQQLEVETGEISELSLADSAHDAELKLDEKDLAIELESVAEALQFEEQPLTTESDYTLDFETQTSVPESTADLTLDKTAGEPDSLNEIDLNADLAGIAQPTSDSDNVVDLKSQRPISVEAERTAITTDNEQAPAQD